jgi:molybdopterin-guanine dinucleotide biosynthesis protein A
MPFMDGDALNRLISAWNPGSSEIVTVSDGIRLHPVVALLDTRLKVSLEKYLANNQRKVETWFHNHYLTLADFSDSPDVLANLNTKEDWQQLGQ